MKVSLTSTCTLRAASVIEISVMQTREVAHGQGKTVLLSDSGKYTSEMSPGTIVAVSKCSVSFAMRMPSDCRCAIEEFRSKQHVRIVEHALLQRDYDELQKRDILIGNKISARVHLTVLEVILNHTANVLCVRQVERRVDLIENVQRRGFVLEHCQHQRQRHQRALTCIEQ